MHAQRDTSGEGTMLTDSVNEPGRISIAHMRRLGKKSLTTPVDHRTFLIDSSNNSYRCTNLCAHHVHAILSRCPYAKRAF